MVVALSTTNPALTSIPQADAPAVKLVPGFDGAGKPLADKDVWAISIGKGKRPLNTAEGSGPGHIDGAERNALLALAKKSPQELMQRLLADSMNGTPVAYNFTKETDIGVVRIAFSADNGQVSTTASLDIFNKSADQYLKPYLAQKARDKGARARVSLSLNGTLNKDGGIDDLKLEASLKSAPKFSVAKLIGIADIQAKLKKAMKAEGPAKDKTAAVLKLATEALDKLSDIPLPFLVKLIGENDVLKAELSGKGLDGKASVKVGKGSLDATLKGFVGKNDDEPDLRASLKGSAPDKDTLSLDELRIYTAEKLAVELADGKMPKLMRVDSKGARSEVNDHFGEIIAYLPMVLALAGKSPL
ncbi:MAG: hypothetical protein U1E65_09870 [Myxococcota bacterium]